MAFSRADATDLREMLEERAIVSIGATTDLREGGSLGVQKVRKALYEGNDLILSEKNMLPAILLHVDNATHTIGETLSRRSATYDMAILIVHQGTNVEAIKEIVQNITDSVLTWLMDQYSWTGDELGGMLGGSSPFKAGAEGFIEDVAVDELSADEVAGGIIRAPQVRFIGQVNVDVNLRIAYT